VAKVLMIDTVEAYVSQIQDLLGRMGHLFSTAATFQEGREKARSNIYDVIFIQSQLSDCSGIKSLSELRELPYTPEIIVISDSGDVDEAEVAIKKGAWDYLERPSNPRKLLLSLIRALEYRNKKAPGRPTDSLKQETFEDIAGNSPQNKECLEVMALAATSDANVLIHGETGTGKELFAWAIHLNSPRVTRQFVVVDCASLPHSLVESTLFGYRKGAFTGAERDQHGLMKRADGGTLFLDEVGELPLGIQKSFLRVLQERRFRPVGGGREILSDFRLIAATNRNLDNMVHEKRFRKDLLFRLRAFSLELPPLRERPGDVEDIANHHMPRICRSYGLTPKQFSPGFFEALTRYAWPGNVRELINALERAITAARSEPVIFLKHLPTYLRVELARSSLSNDSQDDPLVQPFHKGHPVETLPSLREVREAAVCQTEKAYLQELMSITKGDFGLAMTISGLSRSRLYALLNKYNVTAPNE
jgi:two-component system, NtrC family, response regulator